MFKLLFLPIRLTIGFLKLSGIKGLFFLALGVGVGLLIAPQRGEQLRTELLTRLDAARNGGSSGAAGGAEPAG
ncbi:hypothetical protein BH23ACT2_BH23ACT2_22590 [soil metagenome]